MIRAPDMLDGDSPKGATDEMGRALFLALLGLLGLVAIQTFFPLLRVGLITNDDLKLRNAALDRGIAGVASVLWAFTRRDGRLDITQLLSWYPPFAVDSFVYFKAVSLAAIVADLLLFALLARSVFRSSRAFFLALLLALVGLQNSWEHSPLSAFPGLFTLTFAYLLGSLLAFQRFLERGGRRWLLLSGSLFLLVLFSYEMYVLYVPVFLGLALLAGRSRRQALRAMAPHLAGIGLYLAAYLTSRTLRTGNYPGVTIATGLDLQRVAHVVWQFSVSSLPGYFFFNEKYCFLLNSYSKTSGFVGLLRALTAGSIVKAALVGGLYLFLMARPGGPLSLGRRSRLAMLAVAGFYFFVPSFLPALTERYQEEVKQQLGMQCSYFSLFAMVWIATLLLLALHGASGSRARLLLAGITCLPLVFASLVVDHTNAAVGEWQRQSRDRFAIVDDFIATSDYAALPEGALLYAPSLFRGNATLNFMGTAIDPRPSQDPKYQNFWTFYFIRRGGKRVVVTDRLERVPPHQGFFYLNHAQLRNPRDQYLVLAWVNRAGAAGDVLASDRVLVYDRTSWTSTLVGGGLIEPGARASVHLVGGGPTLETFDRFLFPVGSHYDGMGPFQRSALATTSPLLDAESVFLAGSPPLALQNVVKTSGWLQDGWIGAEARATLLPEEPSRLAVDGYAPDYIFKTVGIGTLSVTLELDHAAVATRRVTQGGRFRMETNVEAGAPGELAIHCDPVHSPKAAGISHDDIRQLCVVIDRVLLRKREAGE